MKALTPEKNTQTQAYFNSQASSVMQSDTRDGKWWEEEALSDIIYEQLLVHASLHLHKLEDYCGNHKAGSLLKEG
jgi:hypothetical protein